MQHRGILQKKRGYHRRFAALFFETRRSVRVRIKSRERAIYLTIREGE